MWTALLASALGVRLLWAALTPMVHADGVTFLSLAREASEGRFQALLHHAQHPLYPTLTALAHPLIRDWEWCGLAVAVLAGSLTLVPVVLLGNRVAGPPAGLLGGWLFAVAGYPVEYAGSAISDAPHALFFAASALAGAAALGIGSPPDLLRPRPFGRGSSFFLAGLLSGLAYLTRPEGLLMAGALALGGLAKLLGSPRGSRDPRGFGRGVALLALGLLITAGPYAAYLSYQAGELTLTRKKPILASLGLLGDAREEPQAAGSGIAGSGKGAPPSPAAPRGPAEEPRRPAAPEPAPGLGKRLRAARGEDGEEKGSEGLLKRLPPRLAGLLKSIRNLVKLLGWLPAGLLVLGLAARRRARRPLLAELYLFLPVAGFLLLLSGVYVVAGYSGRRQLYPLSTLLAGWEGAGLLAVSALVARLAPRSRLSGRLGPLLTGLAAAAILGRTCGLLLDSRREENLWPMEAGRALRGTISPADKVLSTGDTVFIAHYTGGRVVAPFGQDRVAPPVACAAAETLGARWTLLEPEEPAVAEPPPGWRVARRLSHGARQPLLLERDERR
jgi:hypothetical protein